MKLKKNHLFGPAAVYAATNAINSAIPFLLMPILTRYLSPKDYGIVAMFGVLLNFAIPFIGLNIDGAIMRQYYERDKIDYPLYISNCLLISIISFIIVGIIVFIFSNKISILTEFPRSWLSIIVVVALAQFMTQIVFMIWRVQVKPFAFGIYQISQTILNFGMTIWFVVVMGMSWRGRIIGNSIAILLFALIGIYVLNKNGLLKIGFNPLYITNALRFGIPMIPHALSGTLINITDRLFITNMVGLEATGLYSVGYSVGMLIGIIQDSFNKAYGPWLFDKLKVNKEKSKLSLVRITYLYYFIILLLAFGLSFIAPWFLNFFLGDKFRGANVYVFWIGLGYAFNGMYKMVVNYIFYVEKTYLLAWITFFSAASNIVFNYYFIRIYGAVGAAQATTLTFLITFILTWILSNKVYPMPWFKIWGKYEEK